MPTIVRRAVVAGLLVIGLSVPPPLAAQEFTDRQREELGTIIRDYLIENPEVLRDVLQALERKSKEAESAATEAVIGERAAEIFRSSDDLVVGNPDGNVTLVEFFDYNCGYCKRSMPDVLKLIESDSDLRVVLKEWPILGPGSSYAAKAALASRRQGKYWEFHLALMSERTVDEKRVIEVATRIGLDVAKLKADMETPEVSSVIDRNMQLADALGLQGTPAFLIDQHLIPGAVGYTALAEVVAGVRRDGGCKVC